MSYSKFQISIYPKDFKDLKLADKHTLNIGKHFLFCWSVEILRSAGVNNLDCFEIFLNSEYIFDHGELKEPEIEAECRVNFLTEQYFGRTREVFEPLWKKCSPGRLFLFKIKREDILDCTTTIEINCSTTMGFRCFSPMYNEIVPFNGTLNIGGTIFETTDHTLKKFDGYFKTYLSLPSSDLQDKKGTLIIDRSSKHFDLILNYMRDGSVALSDSDIEVREIMKEAEYYWLVGLHELCKNHRKIINMDIGGTIFKTTKATLTKSDGMFKTMFENESLMKDTDTIFIDRSPKHFDLILNFLRDGSVDLPEQPRELREIIREAQYYSLPGLSEACMHFFNNGIAQL